MDSYVFRQRQFAALLKDLAPVEIRSATGVVGHVVRGEIDGCGAAGTFRFEPVSGPATSMGINLLHFALTGELEGSTIRTDQVRGGIEVTADGTTIGTFDTFGLDTRVELESTLVIGSVRFGLMILLPFIHQVYERGTGMLADMFE